MIKFDLPLAQAEYERLIAEGMEEGLAHEQVERRRLTGDFLPPAYIQHLRSRPKMFNIVGSDDQKRIARLAAMKEMAEGDPDKFDQYKRQAQAAGVDITGKSYSSGLAAYPGDPDAWIKDDNDIKALARQKGYHVGKEDGLIKVQVPLDPREKSHKQLLRKPRNTRPVVKHRRNVKNV